MDTHSKLVYNEHHIIYRSQWGTNHIGNRETIRVRKHDAWHGAFPDMLPQEQLAEVIRFNEKVFNPEVIQEVKKCVQMILNEPAQYVLKKGLYRPRH